MPFKIIFLILSVFLFYTSATFQWNKSTATKPKDCKPGLVFIDRPASEAGCYPIAAIGAACQFNRQCSALTANSYCGYQMLDEDDPSLVCLCKDGFYLNPDKTACSAFKSCSTADFNSAMEPSEECGLNQFCRQHRCLCAVDHRFDSSGNCIALKASLTVNVAILKNDILRQQVNILQAKVKALWVGIAAMVTLHLVFMCILSAFVYFQLKRIDKVPDYELLERPNSDQFQVNQLYKPCA